MRRISVIENVTKLNDDVARVKHAATLNDAQPP